MFRGGRKKKNIRLQKTGPQLLAVSSNRANEVFLYKPPGTGGARISCNRPWSLHQHQLMLILLGNPYLMPVPSMFSPTRGNPCAYLCLPAAYSLQTSWASLSCPHTAAPRSWLNC